MPTTDDKRAQALRLPASQVRTGDFLTLGGECLRVTSAVPRGGLAWLELGANIRIHLHAQTEMTVIRPTRPFRPVRPVRPLWAR